MSAQQQAGTTVGEVTLGGVPYPLALGPNGLPAPIDVAPQVAFPDAIILGDSSQRSDQRVASVIQSDWTGGIGTLEYIESQGVTTVRDSFADTRYAGVIASSRSNDQVYGTIPGSPIYPGRHIELVTVAGGTRLLSWAQDPGLAYQWDGTNWISPFTYATTGFTRFRGLGVFSTRGGVFTSTDGVTWTVTPGIGVSCRGVAVHDNKVWTLVEGDATLRATTDPAGAATWTTYATLYMQYGEFGMQLFEWRNARGVRALYILTNQRLIAYDDDDKEFATFFDFTEIVQSSGSTYPWAHVWRNNDDLYLTLFNITLPRTPSSVIHFNGSVIEVLDPNKLGGINSGNQFGTLFTIGSIDELFAFAGTIGGTATAGRILAMNSQQGWHTVFTATSANPIVGGGYANGTLYIVLQSGAVTSIYSAGAGGNIVTLPDNASRTYLATAQTVESADLDAGTPGITKRLLWVRIACVVPDAALGSVFGLPAGATVKVEYRVDNGPWTQLTSTKAGGVTTALAGGVLSSAVSFPATLPLGGELGISCTRWNWRLTLTRGTNALVPTLVTQVGWHYIRQPEVRYSYRARVDLRDETWGGEALPQFGGRTAAQLRNALLAWPGNGLTSFAYGYGATRVALTAVDVVVRPVEAAVSQAGMYDVVVRDLTTPNSGV